MICPSFSIVLRTYLELLTFNHMKVSNYYTKSIDSNKGGKKVEIHLTDKQNNLLDFIHHKVT